MIEKGVILEPLPMGFFIILFASLAIRDWYYWVLLCISGLIASITIYVRRTMRMIEVGKVVDTIISQRDQVNDRMSYQMESPNEDEDDENGLEECDGLLEDEEGIKEGEEKFNKKIRVLTYNMYLRPPLINSNGNDWKDERLALFIRHVMPKYDILALQEVFALGSSRQARLILAAKKLGFKWIVKSVAPPLLTSLKFIDAGLLILSKFPIEEASGHIYSTGHQIDHYAAKQVIYAKISIPIQRRRIRNGDQEDESNQKSSKSHEEGEPNQKPSPSHSSSSSSHFIESNSSHINIFTTHTQASYYENSDALNSQNDSARLSQIQELLSFIHQKVHSVPSNAFNPVLILGDLNLDARSSVSDGFQKGPEYRFLQSLFLQQYGSCPLTFFNHRYGNTYSPPSTETMPQNDQSSISEKSPILSLSSSSISSSTPSKDDQVAKYLYSGDGVKMLRSKLAKVKIEEESENQEKEASKYEVRDLILERYGGEHPVTYGDARVDEEGRVVAIQEPVLTNSKDWACRLAIDYIFLITRPHPKDQDESKGEGKNPYWPSVRPISTNIQPFLVDPLKNPFFQLSDHYGVDTTLELS